MLKKLGAAMLVGTMLAGGACYAHEQRDHAKTLAAKAIGIDESKLTFHSIKLKCGDKHQVRGEARCGERQPHRLRLLRTKSSAAPTWGGVFLLRQIKKLPDEMIVDNFFASCYNPIHRRLMTSAPPS